VTNDRDCITVLMALSPTEARTVRQVAKDTGLTFRIAQATLGALHDECLASVAYPSSTWMLRSEGEIARRLCLAATSTGAA
jgi:hypothetical protein